MERQVVGLLLLLTSLKGLEHNVSLEDADLGSIFEMPEPLELDVVANPDLARGHTLYVSAFSNAARRSFCYRIQVGSQVYQDPRGSAAVGNNCHAASYTYSTGRYQSTAGNVQRYGGGTVCGANGPRTSTVAMHVGNHPSVTATVVEGPPCHYVITLTGPAAQLGLPAPAPPPARVDCAGHFTSGPCHCSHTQTYHVTRAARNGGRACPHANGFHQNGACHAMAMSLASDFATPDSQPESAENWTFASGIAIGFGAGLMMAASVAFGYSRSHRSHAVTPEALLG